MRKKLIFLVLALVAITFLLSTNLIKKPKTVSSEPKKTMVMGVSLDYPPFEFLSSGIPQGYDIDLAHMLAEELDFNIEIKDMDFNSLIPALNSKQIDFIISAMSPSSERAKNVDFTNLYYQAKIEIVTLDNASLEEISKFKNKKVGVQMGSTMEAYAKKKRAEIPSLEILSVSRVPALIEELKIGRIDGVILDSEVAKKVISKNFGLKSAVLDDFEGGNAVVLPLNSKLTAEFNNALEKLRKEGKLGRLEEKWITHNRG